MRYSIITPTILRPSLIRLCQSIDHQTCTDWEHIIMVDWGEAPDILAQITHPARSIHHCPFPHRNFGNTCRHNAHPLSKGDYLYYLDDDNYLADDRALERLLAVTAQLALFPILINGQPFYHDPPKLWQVDNANMLRHRDLPPWPAIPLHDADGIYAQELAKRYPCQKFPHMDPITVHFNTQDPQHRA